MLANCTPYNVHKMATTFYYEVNMENLTPEERERIYLEEKEHRDAQEQAIRDKIYAEEKARYEARTRLWRETLGKVFAPLRQLLNSMKKRTVGTSEPGTAPAQSIPQRSPALSKSYWKAAAPALMLGILFAAVLGVVIGVIRHQPDIHAGGQNDNRVLAYIALFLGVFGMSFGIHGTAFLLRKSAKTNVLFAVVWIALTFVFFKSLDMASCRVAHNFVTLVSGEYLARWVELDGGDQKTAWVYGTIYTLVVAISARKYYYSIAPSKGINVVPKPLKSSGLLTLASVLGLFLYLAFSPWTRITLYVSMMTNPEDVAKMLLSMAKENPKQITELVSSLGIRLRIPELPVQEQSGVPSTTTPQGQINISKSPSNPVEDDTVDTGEVDEARYAESQSTPPIMVSIPGGTFTMGSTERTNEQPIRRVTVSSFSMCKYDITVGQYEAYCKDTGKQMPDAPNFDPNWSKKVHPIVNVSWDDANGYCRWLSQKTGKTYDLPTEAEWEYAARGGLEGKKYPCGDEWDKSRCANATNSGGGTVAVGSYPANGYGLNDMSGNVWQWCKDWYATGYDSNDTDNQKGASSGNWRVLRGGSWGSSRPDIFRCAVRIGDNPGGRGRDIGFRVALRGLR